MRLAHKSGFETSVREAGKTEYNLTSRENPAS